MKSTTFLVSALIGLHSLDNQCHADMLPSPNAFRLQKPDGTTTPKLFLVGSIEDSYVEDEQGFTVELDSDGNCEYAVTDTITGDLRKTGCMCGNCDPRRRGIKPHERRSEEVVRVKCGKGCRRKKNGEINPIIKEMKAKKINLKSSAKKKGMDGRKLQVQTQMRNLVVMVRFSDHKNRKLPPLSDFEALFNNQGPHSACPTGSVRDVFQFNSYGELNLNSTIYPWIDVPESEAYYADGYYGMTGKLSVALVYALSKIDRDLNVNFSDFDENNDGQIDAITFIHSGYAAEWGGADCQTGATHINRIWSHKWSLTSGAGAFTSSDNIHVNTYHVSPAVWGTCGTDITRIGVISHETGHFLGLPDLYDGSGGQGVGSYCLMSNSWGFDGSQYHPPMMSPWSKIELGWLDPQEITSWGTYSLSPSHKYPDVYKISMGYAPGEYLLIENRQPSQTGDQYQFEGVLPQGGLCIWHIDEDAGDTVEGYPGMPGWPENGKHYRVALLQADGKYQLERGSNRGDAFDVFHSGGVDEIGRYGVPGNLYPNTDAYGDGVFPTKHRIHSISDPGRTMNFKFEEDQMTQSPTESPSSPPTRTYTTPRLETTFAGGNGRAGNMFDLEALVDIEIKELEIHSTSLSTITCKIYTRPETHVDAYHDSSLWTLRGEVNTIGNGFGRKTSISGFDPIPMNAGERMGFYVVLTSDEIEYSNGASGMYNTLFASDTNLRFYEGTGNAMDFGSKYLSRVWNGAVIYKPTQEVSKNTSSPSVVPSSTPTPPAPTDGPLTSPTNIPSQQPSRSPSKSPVMAPATPSPINAPSKAPSKIPHETPITQSPTTPKSPSLNPTELPSTQQPTNAPSRAPVLSLSTPYQIATTFLGGNGSSGNFFDVLAYKKLEIASFDIHTRIWGPIVTVKVFVKDGTYAGYEKDPEAWGSPICEADVSGKGPGRVTAIPETACKPVTMEASTTKGFYITLLTTDMVYTNGYSEGSVYAQNSHLAIMEGKGAKYFLNRNYRRRIWNGIIHYKSSAQADDDTAYPTGGQLQFNTVPPDFIDGMAGSPCETDDECESEYCEHNKKICSSPPDIPEAEECGIEHDNCLKGSDCCSNYICYKEGKGKKAKGKCMLKSEIE